MMTENISKKFNATKVIHDKMPQIVDAFVEFYGEDEREYIEDRFKNLYIVGYGNPESYKRIIFNNDKKVEEYLQEKILTTLRIPKEQKRKFLTALFDGLDSFNNKATPIECYIACLNGNINDYTCTNATKLLNYYGKNVEARTLIRFLGESGYEELKPVVKAYQEALEEYNQYIQQTKLYRNYIEKCDELYKKLENKYTKEFIYKIKDVFTKDELSKIDEYLELKYPISGSSPKAKNYIGINPLISPALIDAFSSDSERIAQREDTWRKRSIIQDRIAYFKNFGINLGDNYQKYELNKDAQALIPSQELVERIQKIREDTRNQMLIEFYENLPEYIKYRKEIDELKLLDREDNFDAKAYHQNLTFACPNLTFDGHSYHLKQLSFISMGGRPEYLDINIVHELNHTLELSLKEVFPKGYLCTSGWDILEGTITEEKENITNIDSKRNHRPYELFNEIVNELISQEICTIMHQKGNYILNTKEDAKIANGTTYELMKFLVIDFYDEYKKWIIASRKDGNMDILFEQVGKENFDKLNQLINENFNYISFGDAMKLKQIIKTRDEILKNMANYRTNKLK